jgi:NAD(P)-dependent dehydrogenase (short-subunit alcohol dehydrogenase family)
MQLKDQRVLVTGGSRGLGLGIVEALCEEGAKVTVLARDAERLAQVKQRLGVQTIAGDITEQALAAQTIRELRPNALILNAGAHPGMGAIQDISWEDFSATWNTDTRAALFWIQEALRLPLAPGSRVILGSSGAGVAGSPLSGGHAGAKRMIWWMANYANKTSVERELGIRFQTIIPQQIIGETSHGQIAAEAYAKKNGVSVEAFLPRLGKPMSPRQVGDHVVTILTDPTLEGVTAFGLKGDTGITSLDG